MVNCPVCDAEVTVTDNVEQGELISCADCDTELEIKSVNPVTLAEAPQEEEDWGQ